MSRRTPKADNSTAKTRLPPPHQEWLLFCDEAGNAGSNWLDSAQPYHVAAGWLVRPSKRGAFEQVLRDAAADTQATELKGATLLRRASGVRSIVRILRALGPHATPLFVLAERRFCIAGKAVDVFLDPFTNPAADWLPTGAVLRRQGVWEVVSELPDEILARFAEAYRAPTPIGFRDTALAIGHALRATRVAPVVATSFEAAAENAQSICEYETHGSPDAGHRVVTALNTPVFFHVVKKADRLLDATDGDALVVIHDEISRFAAVFARTIRALTVPPGSSPDFHGADGELVRMGVQHVARFEARASTLEVGVQAADLLAASVAKLARDVHEGQPWSEDLHELASLTLPALLTEHEGEEPLLAGMLAHSDSVGRLLLRLFEGSGGPGR